MILGFNKLLACALDETMDIDDSLMDAHNLLDRLEGEFGHNNHMRDMDELMTAAMALHSPALPPPNTKTSISIFTGTIDRNAPYHFISFNPVGNL